MSAPISTSAILRANLLGLVGIAVVVRLLDWGSTEGLGYVVAMALCITGLTLINLLGALFSRGHRREYMLGLLLVLLIGFGLCAGGSFTY